MAATKTAAKTAARQLPVVHLTGEPAGSISVGEEFFTAPINTALLHQLALSYRASRRAGTADTKRRSEVSGGGKKPWKQKHTRRARAGSTRSPLWRHGGLIFGPRRRDMSYRLPQTIRRIALLESLKGKLRAQELVVLEQLEAA